MLHLLYALFLLFDFIAPHKLGTMVVGMMTMATGGGGGGATPTAEPALTELLYMAEDPTSVLDLVLGGTSQYVLKFLL
tara:strand:- start:3152 stop:3385 length:234 start_codon:yes stop_codon:yes gene_type:complete